MKKIFTLLALCFLFCDISLAESYYFKECKISNAVTGNYIINLDKNIIVMLECSGFAETGYTHLSLLSHLHVCVCCEYMYAFFNIIYQ